MKLPSINLSGVTDIAKTVVTQAKESSPAILVAAGTIGLVTGTVMMWKASKKAQEEIREAAVKKAEKEAEDDEEEQEPEDEELTKKETVQAIWKTMLPVVAVEVISVACIIGGYTIKRRRMDAVITAATLSASTLKQYQEKVVETIGEKKEKEIHNKVAQEQVDKKFEANISEDDIVVTGRGTQLFYEPTQNTLFYSDREFITRKINELNMRLRNEMYITLTDVYYEFGLEKTSISDDLGWCIDDGYFEPSFEAIFTKDGRTCAVIDYIPKGPTWNFRNRYA